MVGALFALFLLAFAGIPLTTGFVAKVRRVRRGRLVGRVGLVIVGVLASAVAAYFYLRVIVAMFFTDADDDTPAVGSTSRACATTLPIAVCHRHPRLRHRPAVAVAPRRVRNALPPLASNPPSEPNPTPTEAQSGTEQAYRTSNEPISDGRGAPRGTSGVYRDPGESKCQRAQDSSDEQCR